jgi:hypothetical protein
MARIVGGISKGNVSLSMAVVTDVSSLATRGRGMVCYSCLHFLCMKPIMQSVKHQEL